jgi:hypothetical protein
MKHAGPEALSALGGLLDEIRRGEGIVERRPGVFYRMAAPSFIFMRIRADSMPI